MSARKVMRQAFGDREWWKRDSEKTFHNAAATLLESGWSIDDAADFLEMLHAATAAEYGE